jgi:hypothetical protein
MTIAKWVDQWFRHVTGTPLARAAKYARVLPFRLCPRHALADGGEPFDLGFA